MDNKNLNGYTPLLIASEEGNIQLVLKLVDKQNINESNINGNSALSIAVKLGYHDITKVLIDKGADINHKNNAGQSILFIACWYDQIPCIKMLLEAGADMDAQDQRGWTPLMVASFQGHNKAIQILITHGCNLDLKDSVSFKQFGKKAIDRAKQLSTRKILQQALQERKDDRINQSMKVPVLTQQQMEAVISQARPLNLSYESMKGLEKMQLKSRKAVKEDIDFQVQLQSTTLGNRIEEQWQETLQMQVNSGLEKILDQMVEQTNQRYCRDYNSLWQKTVNFIIKAAEKAPQIMEEICQEDLGVNYSKDVTDQAQRYLSKQANELKDTLLPVQVKLKQKLSIRELLDSIDMKMQQQGKQLKHELMINVKEIIKNRFEHRPPLSISSIQPSSDESDHNDPPIQQNLQRTLKRNQIPQKPQTNVLGTLQAFLKSSDSIFKM